jgi:stearoyl-CoA desaturase (delta-9 desaturase)
MTATRIAVDSYPDPRPDHLQGDPTPAEVRITAVSSFSPAPAEHGARVGTVRPSTGRASQVVTLVAVVVPAVGVLSAMGLLWEVAFHWVDLALFLGLYLVCAFGTTIGFHRYFTHRGFDTGPVVKSALAILGCMTMQGPVTQWVTDHRKHHALSDREGDPHSPHVGHGEGPWSVVRGFVHAHVGWMFSNLGMEQGRLYGRDLYDDRLVRAIDRLYVLWVALSLGIPFAIGYAVGGTLEAGLAGLVWGGLVRIFAYQHATFAVNSICHMFGRRPFRSRDQSRNNWLVAVLVLGEGWHNNHHAFPSSARHGLERWQVDVSWLLIRGLERLGLVWNVRRPTASQLSRRRAPQASEV